MRKIVNITIDRYFIFVGVADVVNIGFFYIRNAFEYKLYFCKE